MRLVWLPHPDNYSQEQGNITDEVWESFNNKEVVAHSLLKTNADTLISVLAWIFDINYKYSIEYSLKLKLFDRFNFILEDMKVDKDKQISTDYIIKKYINENFNLNMVTPYSHKEKLYKAYISKLTLGYYNNK